ncbi:hypothetical protein BFL43_09355 [Williamsia sp. 1135]|nr:hypothetical protein BFL43_09355 [Williamsia sp. 1135]
MVVAATACGMGGASDDRGAVSTTMATQSLPAFTPPATTSWGLAPQQPSTSAALPSALPPGVVVDRLDPTSVALAAARVWFGWDTTTDTSPYQAALRAAPLLTDACAKRLASSPPTGSPGQDWTDLATQRAQARVDAQLGAEDQPSDSESRAVRLVAVTQRWDATAPVAPRRVIAQIALIKTRSDGRWSVTSDAEGRCGVVTR